MRQLQVVSTLAIFAATQAAYATSYSVTKIADTSTPIPGGMGDFTGFDSSSGPFFIAQGSNGQDGIYSFYLGSTTLGVFASNGTAAPGFAVGVTFSSFSSISIGGEGTSFIADNSDGSQGVYESWQYGSPILVAATGQSPSAGVTFSSFTNVSSTYQNNSPLNPTGEFLSNAGVYFFSIGPVGQNNYVGGPVSLQLEANTSTVPQGSSYPFSAIGMPNFKAGYPGGTALGPSSTIQSMAATVNGVQGIYYSLPNHASSAPAPFTKLVDTATPSIVQFTNFGNPAADDSNIIFTAHYNNGGTDQQGIFSFGDYYFDDDPSDPATLQELLASGTVAPNSNGAHFKDFLDVTLGGTILADLDNGTEGIYELASGNTTSDVIDTTDTLDGKTIASFELPPEADFLYQGTSFTVNFTDGSQGLYFEKIAVPEPVFLAMFVGPALLLRRHQRRESAL